MNILWGLLGILAIFAIAFLLSEHKRKINIRTILIGLAMQLLFGFIVLKWEMGREVFLSFTKAVQHLVNYANEGISFLFGPLLQVGDSAAFALSVLPVIIFFSSLIAVLYHLRIMQVIIRFIGGGLAKLLGTSKTESLSAAANIFVGQTEAPLVIKPFIANLTKSELFAVMTGGLASVAGSVLFGYALLGVPLEYLLAASFMAAPAGLIMAKMLIPETEKSKIEEKDIQMAEDEDAANVIDAAAKGASTGLSLALNVGAMLLAFVALIAVLNGILGGIGGWFGFKDLSLEFILGYVFAPLAFVIGVPWDEAVQAGSFIGQKLVLNEFVAYSNFAPMFDQLSVKTASIISFALCGFANLSSVAILLGGLGGMAPNRRSDIARLGLKAVAAGTLANLTSAAIAGMFIG
ncbi:NupC/NupG family nucleoside CNT transporter [Bacillus paralicheniformis]|uniref:NupC/NupG family nucleoside CNT transporter n=1 Tax=Bacillus paralicheniformis TaxID=1648923 RepID=UPI0009B03811|nr:NupC/NupG family nucleoside CNT transporter [Bacillus paralicheniformis]ARA87077.1 NupC/NupG family nucleoside CNT transporter [Bacillus paralicheniformis]MCW4365818.1 NupC/NupG family nucleoside CNT transporter [Bacillus paralicheniformis]MDU0413177.1 NupC/NupG family nucleoside CNT transporter [Bacillus paralicheniformis]MEC2211748.1 NupC/NupG family nucleoside CNT transporter [Bacillus paralicheniformis]PAE03544.1 NupC/NupG family nucleoside CNT transporter [Bacillus paralicheniformis]